MDDVPPPFEMNPLSDMPPPSDVALPRDMNYILDERYFCKMWSLLFDMSKLV
jgi:hypothetical protein